MDGPSQIIIAEIRIKTMAFPLFHIDEVLILRKEYVCGKKQWPGRPVWNMKSNSSNFSQNP